MVNQSNIMALEELKFFLFKNVKYPEGLYKYEEPINAGIKAMEKLSNAEVELIVDTIKYLLKEYNLKNKKTWIINEAIIYHVANKLYHQDRLNVPCEVKIMEGAGCESLFIVRSIKNYFISVQLNY